MYIYPYDNYECCTIRNTNNNNRGNKLESTMNYSEHNVRISIASRFRSTLRVSTFLKTFRNKSRPISVQRIRSLSIPFVPELKDLVENARNFLIIVFSPLLSFPLLYKISAASKRN